MSTTGLSAVQKWFELESCYSCPFQQPVSQAKPYAFSAAVSVVATVVAVCQKTDLDISVREKWIELCLLYLWQEQSEFGACCILERKKSTMSLFKSKCICTHI